MGPWEGCHAPLSRHRLKGYLLVLVAVTGITHKVVIHISLQWGQESQSGLRTQKLSSIPRTPAHRLPLAGRLP